MWLDFDVRDNRRWTFSLEVALLWIMDSYFSRKWQFVSYKNTFVFSFCLLKMLTDGLEWCGSLVDYCDVFISCLDSHSDAPIHWRGSIDETLMECYISTNLMRKQTHLKWPEGEHIFKKILIFVWTVSLNAGRIEKLKRFCVWFSSSSVLAAHYLLSWRICRSVVSGFISCQYHPP